MIVPYVTPLANVVVPRAVPLGDTGLWVTQTSLLDPQGPGLAHLMPIGVATIAKRVGGRMPTQADMLALHVAAAAAGSEIEPVTLPDQHLVAQGCTPGDPRMETRAWCDYGDPLVLARIAALGELGDRPVCGDQKIWTDPLGSLCGWWVADVHPYDPSRHGPGFIQAGGHVVHLVGVLDADGEPIPGTGQSDYGSGGKIVWDHDPTVNDAGDAGQAAA